MNSGKSNLVASIVVHLDIFNKLWALGKKLEPAQTNDHRYVKSKLEILNAVITLILDDFLCIKLLKLCKHMEANGLLSIIILI